MKKFWMISVPETRHGYPNVKGPVVRHPTFELALKEATRLVEDAGVPQAIVLEAVHHVRTNRMVLDFPITEKTS